MEDWNVYTPRIFVSPLKRSWLVILLCLFLLPVLGGQAFAVESLGKAHVDKKVGFSIRTPKDWSFVASQDKDRYIVGTFIAEKRLRVKKMKDIKEWASHRPEMRIIAFTPENKAMARTKKKEREVFGTKFTITTEQNPYRDFKEYIKRTINGFYWGDDKTDRINDVDCTYMDVIMEQARPPLRRVCCVYHLQDVDIAAYYEVMEEYYSDYKSLFSKSFKSFKVVERELVEDGLADAGDAAPMTRDGFIESKTANLPEGWWFKTTKKHLVISHADRKYTDKIAQFADSIRGVIDKDFKKIIKNVKNKKDEVSMPILRVCGSIGEFNAFIDSATGGGAYNSESREVVVFDGTKEGLDLEYVCSRIGNGIFRQYIAEAVELFSPDAWYVAGLSYYYSSFKAKGKSCKYLHNTQVAQYLREAEKRGECKTLKALLSRNSKGLQSTEDVYKVGNFICFLKSKEGSRKPWKGTLEEYQDTYFKTYEEQMAKLQKDRADEIMDQVAKGEDAPEAKKVVKKFKVNLQEISKEIKKSANEAAFGDWDDSDWNKLEKTFLEWVM